MLVLKSSVVPTSEEFRRHRSHYDSLMADLKKHLAFVRAGGR